MVKTYLIDTNIILEWLLKQEKSRQCRLLLGRIKRNQLKAVITAFGLYSIEISLTRRKKFTILNKFLGFLQDLENLTIYQTSLQEEKEIIKIIKKYNLDFDDALHYFTAQNNNWQLVSLDSHFDKTDLKRLEPQDVIVKT